MLNDVYYASILFYLSMGSRIENTSSDAVCYFLYKGEQVYDKVKRETDILGYATKCFLVDRFKEKLDMVNLENQENEDSDEEGDTSQAESDKSE